MNGKMRRVPTYYQDLIDIVKPNQGHLIGSTACLGSFLDRKLLQWVKEGRDENFYQQIIHWVNLMKDIFGEGNFYLELQPDGSEEQTIVNRELITLSDIVNVPYIITNDSHYLMKADAPIHKAFLNSQNGDREVDSFYATTYLMSDEEIRSFNFSEEELQKAYKNILDIKEKCVDYSFKKPLKIPSLYWGEIPNIPHLEIMQWIKKIPYLKTFYESNFDGDVSLVKFIIAKLKSDERLQTQESYDELNKNLEMTWVSSEKNKAHWSAYFLNLREILNTCWEAGSLVAPGRGSGVGFYLLYILDIIQINKLWENTPVYPWRFLNPERVSVLDIDSDIEGSKRSVVLSALRKKYGANRVANVVTLGREGSKSAIQTAARGLGIDNDVSLYISSLIPNDRGQIRSLRECYYGNEDKGYKPISTFIQQMKEYPELWEVSLKIENLISRCGEHAGGVIFVDEDFENSTALMKVPNGDTVTQLDLHAAEAASLIKYDILSIEALDKMHNCLDLLIEQGYIEQQENLKATYEKYLGVYNLERKEPKMWKMIWEHKIQSIFQMDKQSGIQGIALTKPKSVDELAVLNSVIRLMPPEGSNETPLETWTKYRKNINLWYQQMRDYGLTEDEIKWLSNHSAITDGICESQEGLMSLVQEEKLGGHDLNYADRCRKAIAKKQGKLFDECEKEFFKVLEEKHCSEKLGSYVWNILLAVQRGYSFNRSHCLGYSIVGLQEMNLAYKYPIIFWNCACLITDSGGSEDIEEEVVDIYEAEDFEEFEYVDSPDRKTKTKKRKSNNYDKIATAIGKMKAAGIDIAPPDVNKSFYTFKPNVEENRIYFGLRGLLKVGEELILSTIKNRPYTSPKDYLLKVKPTKSSMISLIKSGAFDSMMDRKLCMGWYLWETCDKKSNLTLQNMPGLIRNNLLPTDERSVEAYRVYEFNRYLKAITKAYTPNNKTSYYLDERAIEFLQKINKDDLIQSDLTISVKDWNKVYQKFMDIFREWIAENKVEILTKLNDSIFLEEWKKNAKGNISSWEMDVMCFYYHKHELADVDFEKYHLSDFNKLPAVPVIDRSFPKGDRMINLYKLSLICGTCIAKNKDKATVTLLTSTGVVNVKFRKEYFSLFDRQISQKQPDGTKKVIEKSWFTRGSMIIVQGMRSGDNFIVKKYARSGAEHQLYKITEVLPNNEIVLQSERTQEFED